MNIDKTTLYTLEEILKKVPLPVIVRKPKWPGNLTFRVERVQNGIAYGTPLKNGMDYHSLLIGSNYRLFQSFNYVDGVQHFNIDDLFSNNEEQLFNEVFLKSLYDVKRSGTDDGIFEQCECNLREFLKVNGFNFDDEDRQHLKQCLINSASCKKYGELLESNLEFYTSERNYIPWTGKETKIGIILDEIVQASIQNSRPLTRQYARILASRYYVSDIKSKKTSTEKLYSNLLAFISEAEFNAWVIDCPDCFDNIVIKIKARINKCQVQETVDEYILVNQLIQSQKFKKAVQNNTFLLTNARCGKYKDLIESVFGGTEFDRDTEIKTGEGSSEPQKKSDEAQDEPEKEATQVSSKTEKIADQGSNKRVKKTKRVSYDVEIKKAMEGTKTTVDNRPGLEQLMSGAGKVNHGAATHFAMFWDSIATELRKHEASVGLIESNYNCMLNWSDDDIEHLKY